MKKVLVTGATGFIGRFLVRELVRRGVEVVGVVRRGSRRGDALLQMPIRTVACNLDRLDQLPELIPDRDIDAVFHMAWQGVSDQAVRDADIQLMNVRATLNLIDAAHEMQIGTFVGAGSMHEAEVLVEMRAGRPVSNLGIMYKSAKTAAHWMGKAKAGAYGIRFFWPLINTYGEEEASARLINTVVRKIYRGESPALSTGEQFYDFVHVSDVARALYLIAEKGVDGANYVIGSGDARPLKEFLVTVGRTANKLKGGTDVPLGFGKITSGVVSLPKEVFDTTNLVRDTGFAPALSFEEGILRTASWIWDAERNTAHK